MACAAAISRLHPGVACRSRVSNTSLHLVFTNHTAARVMVYWLDFTGARVWYYTLGPGESYRQQTFVTHPWVVVDPQGRCVEQLIPNAAGTFDVPIRNA